MTLCGHNEYLDVVVNECSACSHVCRPELPLQFCIQNCPRESPDLCVATLLNDIRYYVSPVLGAYTVIQGPTHVFSAVTICPDFFRDSNFDIDGLSGKITRSFGTLNCPEFRTHCPDFCRTLNVM